MKMTAMVMNMLTSILMHVVLHVGMESQMDTNMGMSIMNRVDMIAARVPKTMIIVRINMKISVPKITTIPLTHMLTTITVTTR